MVEATFETPPAPATLSPPDKKDRETQSYGWRENFKRFLCERGEGNSVWLRLSYDEALTDQQKQELKVVKGMPFDLVVRIDIHFIN